MRGTRGGEIGCDCAPLARGGLGEPRAQARVARVDAEARPRLRIGEPHLPHVDELAPRAGRGSRPRARRGVRRGRRAAAASRAGRGSRTRRRRASAAAPRHRAARGRARAPARRPRPVSSSPSASSSPTSPARPCRGGSGTAEPLPNETRPTRFPRRLAAWPSASATPSATSALRRSAVPKPIEGVRSSTIQLTRTRSASCTRTCASRVRAVTFQSISRTSSPGTYGRTCASSLPRPSRCERWSPASRPSTRRPIDSSRARSSGSGIGPGPGRSGVSTTPNARSAAHAATGLPSSSGGAATAPSTASSTSSALRCSASAR